MPSPSIAFYRYPFPLTETLLCDTYSADADSSAAAVPRRDEVFPRNQRACLALTALTLPPQYKILASEIQFAALRGRTLVITARGRKSRSNRF